MRHAWGHCVAPAGKRQISWLKKPRTAVEPEERILQDVVMQDRVLQKSLRDCKQVKNRKSRDRMLQHCRLRPTLVEDVQVTIEGVLIALPIPASESMLGTGEVLLLLPGCPTLLPALVGDNQQGFIFFNSFWGRFYAILLRHIACFLGP